MGLDMYLYVRDYKSLSKWDKNFTNKKVDSFYPKDLQEFARNHIKNNFLSKQTMYQVGYWRKFNALHNWFVERCADGEDNCQLIYVSHEKFLELKTICEKVLKDHSLAKELLPTQDGFFFGTTEYDEWYFSDLEYTLELFNEIEKLLNKTNYELLYEASW